MNLKIVLALVIAFVVAGALVVLYSQAQRKQAEADALRELTMPAATEAAAAEEIWIGSDACNSTFGTDAVALCDGEVKTSNLFLDEGADVKTIECLEYVADKLGRPASDARGLACEVKGAYGDRDFEYDSENDRYGIQNTLSKILNEHLNR